MNEQQKKDYFSLNNNDLEYMSPYSSNIKPDSYLTMSDAIKEYTINLDTSKNIMQGIEPKEAGVLGKIGQGVKNWFSNITDLPSNVADSITTSLNGYTSPNMTEEEANILLESVARGQKAKNELKSKEAYWTGTQDSIITGLTESAVDMVGLALLNTFSGGLGSAYMGSRTYADITEKFSQNYLDKHGSMEGYEGGKNSAIALAHAGFSTWLESKYGLEKLWKGVANKFAKGSGVSFIDKIAGKTGGRILKTAGEEGFEEFVQAESEYAAGLLADAEDRSFMESLKDATIQGVWGAILGGAFGTGTYYIQRNKISNRLQEMYGLDNQSATTIADSLLEEGKNATMQEMNIQNQLTEHYGDSYIQLVDKIKTSLINAGWEAKNPDKDINQYARLSANNIGLEIMRQANLLNMTTTDYFDISQIEVVDNIVLLNKQNYQDPAIVKQQITDKKAELKELNKQVGIDNKARKDVLRQQIKTLQYIQDKMGYNEAILKDKQQNEIVNYLGETSTIKTEIDNAFKDATALRSNKLDTSNMIDPATVITRRTNAVMANILKNKTLYQSLVLEDRIPVAKRNIIANIPDIVSIGKKTDLNKELQQALTKLPNTSKENFSMSVGNDTNVNALLYAFTFGSDVQIQEFLENYIDKINRKKNKKNISFTKRDMALQTLQESSITDGLIKDGVITDKDLKSVFMNTNDVDNTVEKILFQEDLGTKPQEYTQDTINIDGVEKSALNSEGNYLGRTEEEIRNFYKWFGDSKVVDEEGKPLVVYHGTTEQFDTFDRTKSRANMEIQGNFFSPYGIDAGGYGDNLRAFYIKLENPASEGQSYKILKSYQGQNSAGEKTTNELIKQGYDGVNREGEEYIVFDSNHIKSVENKGTYSSDTGNIYYQSKITDLFKPENIVENLNNLTEEQQKKIKKLKGLQKDNFGQNLREQSFENFVESYLIKDHNEYVDGITHLWDFVETQGMNLEEINNEIIENKDNPFKKAFDRTEPFKTEQEAFEYLKEREKNNYQVEEEIKDLDSYQLEQLRDEFQDYYTRKDFFDDYQMLVNDIAEDMGFDTELSDSEVSDSRYIKLLDENEDVIEEIRISDHQTYKFYGNKIQLDTNLPIDQQIAELIEVLKKLKNGEDITGEGIYYQNANGFFDSELKAIVLGSNFNFGTLPHEMAHFFLDKNFKIWKRGDAPAKFMKDFNAIANILGISPEQESLTRDQQEMYASMTEAYIFGKGIPQGTEATLKSYWDWCPPQYNSILDIGFRDSEGKIQNPILTKEAIEYFNNMYSQLALIDSPYSQSLNNPTTNEGDKLPVSKDERIERKNNINDNMTQSLKDIMQPDTPSEAIARTKAQNSFIDPMDSYIDEVSSRKEKEKNISFTEKIQQVLPGRGRNTREQMELSAQKYIEKNKEHALEVAFGSPVDDLSMTSDFVYNDTGIERAVLIREVMKLYPENSTEWSMLYHNFAVYRSEQGKAAGLTNDINTQLYMSGYARLVNLMETKAAAIRYGKGNDSVDRFNADVDKFVASWIDTILNTEPESKERDVAINNFLNSAKQEFGTDEAIQLFQEDISRMKRARKGQKKSFEDMARRKVKQLANAIPSNMDINQLMLLAREAQIQLKNIDSNNVDEAIAAGKAIRNFQEYIAEKGLDDSFFQKLIGAYAPRAMLSRPSTHLANIVSNSVEMYTVKSGLRLHYGKNVVSKNLIKAESERLSEIYKNTGFNLAQQYTINDKALLHGEEYRTKPATEVKGIGKLDPLKLLGDSDFVFRRELYLDALASICSKQAKGNVAKANELFTEYKKLGTLNEDALKARKEALLVANIGVFTHNGTFARTLTQIRNSLDVINVDISKQGIAFGVKGGKGLGTLLAPFIKTPANIIELGARAIASPISSLVALKNNTYNIQHTIDLANLSMSLLIFGIVSALGGKYTGEKNKYNPLEDTISFGDISIKLDLLGPIAQPLRQIYSAIDGEINTGLGQLPIYTEVRDLETARTSPIKFANSFMAEQVGKLIPSILKPSLQATGQQTDVRITDKWIKPYARNIGIVESRTAPDDYIEALVKTFLGSKVQIKDL